VVLLIRACGKSLPMLFSFLWRFLGFDAPFLIRTLAVEYQIAWIFYLIYFIFPFCLAMVVPIPLVLQNVVIIISDDRFVKPAVQFPIIPNHHLLGPLSCTISLSSNSLPLELLCNELEHPFQLHE
jgi:hypothetical protein